MYFDQNLQSLRQYHPHVSELISQVQESDFSLEQDHFYFWGLPVAECPTTRDWQVSSATFLLLYGLDLCTTSLLSYSFERLHIYESRPEVLWVLMHHQDLCALFSDSRVVLYIAESPLLVAEYQKFLASFYDWGRIDFLFSSLALRLSEHFPDPFLMVFQVKQKELVNVKRRPYAQGGLLLKQIYEDMEPYLRDAHSHHALSCHSGCSSCCETSVGFHLCLNPLEWMLVYEGIQKLSKKQRESLFQNVIEMLWKYQDLLTEILFYFDTQPERLADPAFHLEVLEIARPARQSGCVFLQDQRCSIYESRPFTCRVFGSGYEVGRQSFTCEKDWDTMERILLDEGSKNFLVDVSSFRKRVWVLHDNLTYKHVMNAWLFMHLDFENRDFLPCRLDFFQFQILLENKLALQKRWDLLESAL